MSPATLFAAVAGVLVTGGILLGVWAWQPRPERPTRPHRQGRLSKWWAQVSPVRRLTILAAALVGLLLALTTGWMVAVVALPAAALGLPTILMSSGEARSLARLGAIADWTRNLAGELSRPGRSWRVRSPRACDPRRRRSGPRWAAWPHGYGHGGRRSPRCVPSQTTCMTSPATWWRRR